MKVSTIELGNLNPLRELEASLADYEGKIRLRPIPDSDPVVQAVGSFRQQLGRALEEAADIELELSAKQYAALKGVTPNTIYKRWQRGKLPEARMRGGKLVVPVSALGLNGS
jgi:hypothetical protein